MTPEPPRRDAPSAYKTEQAVATWQSTRASLLAEDPDLEHDEAALTDLLGAEEGDVRDILARLLRASVYAGDMSEAAKKRAAANADRAKRFERREDTCRAAAYAIMDILGIRKEELPDLSASISKGKPAAVITDEAAVLAQEAFVRTPKPEIDKAALLAELKKRDAERAAILRADMADGVVTDPAALPQPIAGAFLGNGMDVLRIITR